MGNIAKMWGAQSPRLRVCKASTSSHKGVSAEWEEWGGGRGGKQGKGRWRGRDGVSCLGGITDVQRCDDCWYWMARIVLRVQRAFPFHPYALVLQCGG